MARAKKLASPVTLFAAIEEDQYETLRNLAFSQRRSLADLTRDAIAAYLSQHNVPAVTRKALKRRRVAAG